LNSSQDCILTNQVLNKLNLLVLVSFVVNPKVTAIFRFSIGFKLRQKSGFGGWLKYYSPIATHGKNFGLILLPLTRGVRYKKQKY
jgi:hypothetical protein